MPNSMRFDVNDHDLKETILGLRRFGTDTATVEAKRATTEVPKSLRPTLSAFSNTNGGGVVILGLDEKTGFAATGVADPAKVASVLADWCSTMFEPPVRSTVGIHTFEDVQLVVAEVPELPVALRPCFIKSVGMDRGSYRRTADGDFQLNTHEVSTLISNRSQPRNDEEPVVGANIHDLDTPALSALLIRLRSRSPRSFPPDMDDLEALQKLFILVEVNGALVPSVGGLLALAKHPQLFFPQLNVTFVHYPTADGQDLRTGERFLDSGKFDGPIPTMVQDALSMVRRNMARRSLVHGAGRRDLPEYPELALREAIVNALIHRDLTDSARGTQVQIEMYPDRIEIRNPGGLYGPVAVDQLGVLPASSSRNARLVSILEDVVIPGQQEAVCENRGSGIKIMIQALLAAGMSKPKFDDRVTGFQVTFPNHALLDRDTVEWIESLNQTGLTDSQHVALALMRQGTTMTNALYRDGARIDSSQARAELKDLVTRGLVLVTGTNRWAAYNLVDRLLTSTGRTSRPSPADRRGQILRILGRDQLSRAEIQQQTGLSAQAVRSWLKILQDEHRIRLNGKPQSNSARYYAIPPFVDEPGEQLALDLHN